MNKEGINKYNVLLIKYLNDFVNNVTTVDEIRTRSINDVLSKFIKQLEELEISPQKDALEKIIDNSFIMLSDILKKYFDNSGIHRINDNNESISDIANEMNTVTTNLSKAINESNKMDEYINFINKIKVTITYFISQTCPNYKGKEYEVDQVINELVVSFYSLITNDEIDSFNKNCLPELYKICDGLNYANVSLQPDKENYPNENRDKFIHETLDINIKEGFKDGKVTLTIEDGSGQPKILVGQKAIDQIKSYNDLYTSSRPGAVVDTSNIDNIVKLPPKMEDTAPIEVIDEENIKVNEVLPMDVNIENNENANIQNEEIDFNNLTQASGYNYNNNNENMIKDFLNKYNNEQITPVKEESVNTEPQFNDLVMPSENVEPNYDNTNQPEMVQETKPENNQEPDFKEQTVEASNENRFIPDNNHSQEVPTTNKFIPDDNHNQETPVENKFIPDNNYNQEVPTTNKFIPENNNQEPVVTQTNNRFISNNNDFIPDYKNLNYDRDMFIKRTTGIEIEEDIDTRGKIFLRVTEPSGREVIYTGKEAVRMIKNYNKAYLDANPNRSVDTSLIDKFQE